MKKQPLRLSDEIRLAIDSSGMSRYRICKLLGIAESTMSRFMNGQGGLSMEVLDGLAAILDLHITSPKRMRSKRKE